MLLVEAALAAVVIAVGLVFITRALGTHVKALETVEDYAVLRQLAQQAWLTAELNVQQPGAVAALAREGRFPEPNDPNTSYEWRLDVEPRLDDFGGSGEVSQVTLTVHRTDRTVPRVSLQGLWPTALVPAEWR